MTDNPRQKREAADKAFQDSLKQLRSAFELPSQATDSSPQGEPSAAPADEPPTDFDQSLDSAVADIEEFFRSPERGSEQP